MSTGTATRPGARRGAARLGAPSRRPGQPLRRRRGGATGSYAGKGTQALATLETQVKALDEKGQTSAFLYLTQGIIQMSSVTSSARATAWRRRSRPRRATRACTRPWARCYRRRGDARAADQNYGFALRYEKDHPESLLGRALLALDSDNAAGFPAAAVNLKKLLDADPPPSPRQLAVAHLARALLV